MRARTVRMATARLIAPLFPPLSTSFAPVVTALSAPFASILPPISPCCAPPDRRAHEGCPYGRQGAGVKLGNPKGRNREVVADHQGGGNQSGLSPSARVACVRSTIFSNVRFWPKADIGQRLAGSPMSASGPKRTLGRDWLDVRF